MEGNGMAITLGIVAVVLILAIWIKPKRDTTQFGSYGSANEKPYDMNWWEPNPNNLWNSFDYFVHVGEARARNSDQIDECYVYIHCVISDIPSAKRSRGYFEIGVEPLDSIQYLMPDIPYIQTIQPAHSGGLFLHSFEGFDPSSTFLFLEEDKIRWCIMDDAPHATGVEFETFDYRGGGRVATVTVRFRGVRELRT